MKKNVNTYEDFATNYRRMTDFDYYWWLAKARLRHLINRHTMVAVEHWNKTPSGKFEIAKHGWKCWICNYQEL